MLLRLLLRVFGIRHYLSGATDLPASERLDHIQDLFSELQRLVVEQQARQPARKVRFWFRLKCAWNAFRTTQSAYYFYISVGKSDEAKRLRYPLLRASEAQTIEEMRERVLEIFTDVGR